jgi:hypothetical protein
MKLFTRIAWITLAIGLGIAGVFMTTTNLSATAITAEADLVMEARAPEHVAADAEFIVNIAYANQGTIQATGNQVTAVLPQAAQFVAATTPAGDPFPPDAIDGNTLTWDVPPINPDGTWDHIFVILQPDASVQEGDLLTTTASIATASAESDLDNNTASATSMVCEMAGSAKQVHARTILPGDVLTYTIRVNLAQRTGSGEMGRWVTLTDTLPFSHQVRFLGWNGAVTGTQIDGHVLQWQGRVQAGEPISLQYRLGVEGDVTPGTVITNAAHLGWSGHKLGLGPVSSTVVLPPGMLALGPGQGGQLRHTYGVTLDVPPGAVSDTTRFQLGPLFTDTHPATPPGGLLFANRAFEAHAFCFGEPVAQFSRPLTITVHYSDSDVLGLERETLRLWTREGPEGPWASLGEPARVMSGALAFTTTHFSEFALFGKAEHAVYLPMAMR